MSLRVTNNSAKMTITKMENNDIVSFLSTRLINYLNLTKKNTKVNLWSTVFPIKLWTVMPRNKSNRQFCLVNTRL